MNEEWSHPPPQQQQLSIQQQHSIQQHSLQQHHNIQQLQQQPSIQQPHRLKKTSDILLLCKYPGCLKEFTTRWSFTRHVKIHSGVKPFTCNHCNKQFIQKCSLTRHEQTHLDERPWICDTLHCGKRFKLKEYLEIHKKSHLQLNNNISSNICSSSNSTDGDQSKRSVPEDDDAIDEDPL